MVVAEETAEAVVEEEPVLEVRELQDFKGVVEVRASHMPLSGATRLTRPAGALRAQATNAKPTEPAKVASKGLIEKKQEENKPSLSAQFDLMFKK